jgi:trans-aconitate methyltransferase
LSAKRANALRVDKDSIWSQPWHRERSRFVRFRTRYTFERLVNLSGDGAVRILDFGCGQGHSIYVLLEMFPNARFVCADIATDDLTELMIHFGNEARVQIVEMSHSTDTANLGCDYDVVQLNAVFEHLLPVERKALMPDLWRRLRTGGYLVLTETPWRWFPLETHTTSFPFVNYLPDRLALAAVRNCGRYSKTVTWNEALRLGVRGATYDEIISCLDVPAFAFELVQPQTPDARDLLEVWWQGEIRKTRAKAFTYHTLRLFQRATGILISPWINFALQKLS